MKPVVVQVGSREISVPQEPLRTRFIRSHNRFELIQPESSHLIIKYHRGVRFFALILCVLGLPVLVFGLLGVIGIILNPEKSSPVATVLLLLWGGVMFFMGLWLRGLHFRFDLSSGQVSIRFFLWSRQLSMKEIVAVQVIEAGRFASGSADSFGGPQARFSSFQLNLVLDNASEPRMFVAYNSDLTDMVRKAQILAHFLNVPLTGSGQIQAIAGTYQSQDVAKTDNEPAGRFRGSRALHPVKDNMLQNPFNVWIDRTQPLPDQVELLPRSIDLLYDLGMFLILGLLFLGMPALMIIMFWTAFEQGEWRLILPISIVSILLASIPLLLLRRICISLGAFFDQKRGRLRQGIFVGPEGVLVRMEPNHCYPIALDRFVKARMDVIEDRNATSTFVIETLDGIIENFSYRMSFSTDQLNQSVKRKQA